jgi:hypothetical protein
MSAFGYSRIYFTGCRVREESQQGLSFVFPEHHFQIPVITLITGVLINGVIRSIYKFLSCMIFFDVFIKDFSMQKSYQTNQAKSSSMLHAQSLVGWVEAPNPTKKEGVRLKLRLKFGKMLFYEVRSEIIQKYLENAFCA